MPALIFVLALAVAFSVLFAWAFRNLPRERWQFIAAVPRQMNADGTWQGINLTFYGFFNANAYLLAAAAVFVLLGALAVPPAAILVFTTCLLAVCVPASRLVARLVEKKRYTFSVAGAAFVGLLIGPWLAWAMDAALGPHFGFRFPTAAAVAAISVAYALGEGSGRLACISFGCCYGKPLAALPPLVRRLLRGRSFTFRGKTRKIAYAGGLDGEKVAPVQALTAVWFTFWALAGIYAFLQGHFRGAFLVTLLPTQLWRFASEFLRADYRGQGRLSAYQRMCLLAVLCAGAAAGAMPLPPPGPSPDLAAGLASLWHPGRLLFFEALWVFTFLYTGRSEVTDSRLSFGVIRGRV